MRKSSILILFLITQAHALELQFNAAPDPSLTNCSVIPTVLNAFRMAANPSKIIIWFNVGIVEKTVTNAANFQMDHGVSVLRAERGPAINAVIITASGGLSDDETYWITANVEDYCRNRWGAQVPVRPYRPRLSAGMKSARVTEIFWVTLTSRYVLEQKDLESPAWEPVDEPVNKVDGFNRVFVDHGVGTRIFRLRRIED